MPEVVRGRWTKRVIGSTYSWLNDIIDVETKERHSLMFAHVENKNYLLLCPKRTILDKGVTPPTHTLNPYGVLKCALVTMLQTCSSYGAGRISEIKHLIILHS